MFPINNMNGPENSAAGVRTAPPFTRERGSRNLRILYAEDLPELRDVARISFSRDGHEIECAEDGAVAWQKISDNPSRFDLVITDHHMPNMNGLELVLRLRSLPFPGKIMLFSSELSREIASSYRQQNVDRILFKPVMPTLLRRTLEEMFPAEASGGAVANANSSIKA